MRGMIFKIKRFLFVTLRIEKYKLLSDCKQVSGRTGIKLYHPLLLSGKGKIIIGDNLQNGVIGSANYYSHYNFVQARHENSEVTIGNDVIFTNGISIVAESKIVIEDKVIVALNCSFVDSDGHDLDPDLRVTGKPKIAPITIKENVILYPNVIVLKGVTIGRNSVIGSGSVVTKDIPDNVFAAGIPAKVIRNL